MNKIEFIESIKNRTKTLAVDIIIYYNSMKKTDATFIVGKQLIRSVTSTAANYRAACLARSKKEFYSKISIVVEEADETLFWLEILNETKLARKQTLEPFIAESLEILKIVSKARKNTNFD